MLGFTVWLIQPIQNPCTPPKEALYIFNFRIITKSEKLPAPKTRSTPKVVGSFSSALVDGSGSWFERCLKDRGEGGGGGRGKSGLSKLSLQIGL